MPLIWDPCGTLLAPTRILHARVPCLMGESPRKLNRIKKEEKEKKKHKPLYSAVDRQKGGRGRESLRACIIVRFATCMREERPLTKR